MLSVENLDVYYGQSHILRQVSLQVPAGQIVCLMGRNGAGKTTLLKGIMGLLPVRSGRVIFNGKDITRRSTHERVRMGIGYVPQGREIFPQLNVGENLRLGLEARKDKRQTIPEEVFHLFPVLKTMLQRQGGVLSGGQQQQLAIARALVGEPQLLLLDEPTEGIQPSIILEIEEVIAHLKAEGKITILLVEQYIEFAERLADRYYIMDKGTIVAQGTRQEIGEEIVRRHLTV
jgi:urea transport system ATP-binding protein